MSLPGGSEAVIGFEDEEAGAAFTVFFDLFHRNTAKKTGKCKKCILSQTNQDEIILSNTLYCNNNLII